MQGEFMGRGIERAWRWIEREIHRIDHRNDDFERGWPGFERERYDIERLRQEFDRCGSDSERSSGGIDRLYDFMSAALSSLSVDNFSLPLVSQFHMWIAFNLSPYHQPIF